MRNALAAGVIVGAGLVAGCGSSPPRQPAEPTQAGATTAQPAAKMATFERSGFLLAGAEYWPYHGGEDIKYPEEVLWGFYPEKGVVPEGETDPNPASARPEAIACAERAYAALQAFLDEPPAKLRRIIELGTLTGDVVPRFYLWTNDYGDAADPYPPGLREARLWYWKRKTPEPPKPPGYWKWESRVTQQGECQIPSEPQIDRYLTDMLAEMENRAANPPR